MRIPTHRAPTPPGEMLLEEFLKPMNLSQEVLAAELGLPIAQVEAIVTEQQPITPIFALRLARFFGMSVDFWMNLQLRWDLYHLQQQEAEALSKIRLYTAVISPENQAALS
ncbi:MAG: HigA family addiction module antitoxin [Prochlorotrichaceae cyanobacterium]